MLTVVPVVVLGIISRCWSWQTVVGYVVSGLQVLLTNLKEPLLLSCPLSVGSVWTWKRELGSPGVLRQPRDRCNAGSRCANAYRLNNVSTVEPDEEAED